MKTTLSLAVTAATALFGASLVAADSMTAEGCYSSTTGLTLNSTWSWNSRGYCGTTQCLPLGYAVFAVSGTDCYCGNSLPPSSAKLADSACAQTCPGYPSETCGGPSKWSLYLTGLTNTVPGSDSSSPSSSAVTSAAQAAATTGSSTTTAKPSTVTVEGQTIVVTAGASTTAISANSAAASSSSSSPSKAGIAVGVVVGLVVMAAMAGGLFIWLRNRRRREVEEDYRRNAAVASGKPGSSAGQSFADTRLEPAIMAHRRMSDGSIMDNQDYSRRILKVTNA